MSNDCVFCQIAQGAAPASIIYEDDQALVILDLFPVSEGHVLIIPKRHACLLEQLDQDDSAHLFNLARCAIKAQKKAGLSVDGHNVVVNDGPAANQHIPHVHLHVIPRKKGDTLKVAAVWSTRLFNVFGLAKRRKRLDRLASFLNEHFSLDD